MANTLLTSDIIVRTALAELHEECPILGKINRQYDDRFAKDGVNGKVGNQIRIRKPAKLKVIRSWIHTPQDFIEEEVYLPVQAPYQVPLTFTDSELTLDIHDFATQVIRPAAKRLATEVTADVLGLAKKMANSVYNASGLVFDDVLEANSKLYRSLVPDADELCLMLDTGTNRALVSELKGLYQSANEISEQYKKGVMGIAGGFLFYRSNLLSSVVNPADIVGTVTVTEGAETAIISGLTDGQVVPAGFRFTVAGSYKVHPEKQDIIYPDLYEFVVLEDVTVAAGAATVSIYKVIGSATDARRNISVIPGAASAINVIGDAGATLVQNFAFAKDSITFASIDLEKPTDVDMIGREEMDGVSMRFIRQYSAANTEYITRLDVLAAFAVLRETFGCALINPA